MPHPHLQPVTQTPISLQEPSNLIYKVPRNLCSNLYKYLLLTSSVQLLQGLHPAPGMLVQSPSWDELHRIYLYWNNLGGLQNNMEFASPPHPASTSTLLVRIQTCWQEELEGEVRRWTCLRNKSCCYAIKIPAPSVKYMVFYKGNPVPFTLTGSAWIRILFAIAQNSWDTHHG